MILCTLIAASIAAAPAPYSLPWQLRPATVGTVVRLDSVMVFAENPAGDATQTWVSLLLLSYKVVPEFSPFVRLGMVQSSDPGGVSLTNLALGGTFALKSDPLRFAATLGVAIPMGMGGGNEPDLALQATTRAGVLARSAMDNAMFAVNDLVIFPGLDLAYVADGFTVQAEVTLLELIRARGEDAQPDAAKTNLTMGLHAGYFIVPELSVGAELRYQRWLSTPVAVERDASGASRDNLSMAVGIRAHFELGEGVWARPGLAYARGLDDPMSSRSMNIVQLDLPFAF